MRVNRNLSILLSGQLVSQIGDKFYLLALSYWVLESTGSASMMGLVLFCSLFPETVTGLVAGAMVDRYSRKLIIVGTDMFRGTIVLGLSLLFYLDQVSIIWIIIAQVLLSLNTAFFNPCIPALIPQIVDPDALGKANAQTQLIRGISTILGPVLGGISVAMFGYLFVFIFNGISFVLSGLFELLLKIPETEKTESNSGLLDDIKEGFYFLVNEKTLLMLIAAVAAIHFFVGAFQMVTPVLATLITGTGIQNLGFIQTAFGVGMVSLSSVFAALNLLNKREGLFLFGSVFLIGLMNSGVALLVYLKVGLIYFYLIPFFIYGGCVILAVTAFRTLVQKSTPNRMAGRIFGVAFSVGDASIPLAMIIYGVLLDLFPIYHLLFISGFSLMMLAILFVRRFQPVVATDIKITC